jgi:tRNA 2-thiouridine synthesizing protein E
MRKRDATRAQEHNILNVQVLRDSEGYLVDTDDWSEDFSEMVAKEEGVTLNDLCWSLINFMRSYYDDHQVAPDVRHVTRNLAVVNGCSKKEAKKIVFDLFPYGYVKQACKIAGMKKPRAWSTG